MEVEAVDEGKLNNIFLKVQRMPVNKLIGVIKLGETEEEIHNFISKNADKLEITIKMI